MQLQSLNEKKGEEKNKITHNNHIHMIQKTNLLTVNKKNREVQELVY